jgi:hypothetical protein
VPALAGLLAQLDAIDLACRESRWDDAERLYVAYDAAVRAVPRHSWDPQQLDQLIQRQQALEARMRIDRDSAAGELGQLGAQRRGAKAYQG